MHTEYQMNIKYQIVAKYHAQITMLNTSTTHLFAYKMQINWELRHNIEHII